MDGKGIRLRSNHFLLGQFWPISRCEFVVSFRECNSPWLFGSKKKNSLQLITKAPENRPNAPKANFIVSKDSFQKSTWSRRKKNEKKKTKNGLPFFSNQLSSTLLDVNSEIPNYTWTSPQLGIARGGRLDSIDWMDSGVRNSRTSWRCCVVFLWYWLEKNLH